MVPNLKGGDANVLDLLYSDISLVSLYDKLNAEGYDFQFYEKKIGFARQRVVDLGCGTGRLALSLAKAGHNVIGIDPAPEMLSVAKKRPGGDAVRWVQGDASVLRGETEVDVVVMTGHAFQCLLCDDALSLTFDSIRTALAPGGRFMFESRNPLDRAWERWTPEASLQTVLDNSGNRVSARHSVIFMQGEFVTFATNYELPGGRLTSQSTLRFLPQTQIDQRLKDNGFVDIDYYGDWSGSSFVSSSREIVVIAS